MQSARPTATFSKRSLPLGKLLIAEPMFFLFVVLAGPIAMWGFACIAAVNVICAAFVKDTCWWAPGGRLWSAWVGRSAFVALAGLWLVAGKYLAK